MPASLVFPGKSDRTVIVGQTGSGKSLAGAHMLLQYRKRYPRFPWVIFNPKRDRLLDSIGANPLQLEKGLSKKGIDGDMVIYHPVPEAEDDDEHVNNIIDQVMWLGNTGIYIDEGYSIPKNSKSFRRALTQGRSKNVPVITLSQRPVFLDKFVFTEAGFVRAFYLTDVKDRLKIRENTGIKITDDLPLYGSHWYDVSQRSSWQMSPGPTGREIVNGFRELSPPPEKSWFSKLVSKRD